MNSQDNVDIFKRKLRFSEQKNLQRVETIKCTTSRNNLPIQGLLLRLLCNFTI